MLRREGTPPPSTPTSAPSSQATKPSIRGVWRQPELRRLACGWSAFFFVDWTVLVAVSVWAFERGGPGAVALLGLCRLLPGAVALPFGAWAADRFPRHRLLAAILVAQIAALLALVGAISTDLPWAVYSLVALAGVVSAPYRPAHLALLPLVARTPQDLVAANVAGGVLEGAATLVGPALAGALLVVGSPEWVILLALAASVLGLLAVLRVRPTTDPSASNRLQREPPLRALVGGVAEMIRHPDQGLIVACFTMQLFVRGLLTVLIVVVAFDLFDLGQSGVGWLGAAMGVGGMVGAVLAVRLAGRRRLGGPMLVGLFLWGAPIALMGLVVHPVVGIVAMATVGLGNFVLDVTGMTLLQRLGDDRMLGRVFGLMYMLGTALAGFGALLAPVLVDVFGLRPALVVVGSLLPLTVLLAARGVRRIDARSEPPASLDVLAATDLFGPLPPTTLEKLAAQTRPVTVAPGDVVVSEGARADEFYVIADGEVRVTRSDGSGATLGTGDYFGEVALLRSVTRTATVTATMPTDLLVIDGPVFLAAVTGDRIVHETATAVVDRRS